MFRLRRMHEIQTTVTDVRGVCQSVCLSRGLSRLHCAQMAEQIEILFGVNTLGGPWSIVLDGGGGVLIPHRGGGTYVLLNFGTNVVPPERLMLEA